MHELQRLNEQDIYGYYDSAGNRYLIFSHADLIFYTRMLLVQRLLMHR